MFSLCCISLISLFIVHLQNIFSLILLFSHPDVFMESYYYNSVAPFFFMVYIFVTFYYFSNVVCISVNKSTYAYRYNDFITAFSSGVCKIQRSRKEEM